MNVGDKVIVRNIGTDPNDEKSWARATVVRPGPDDATIVVKVEEPDHALDGRELIVDREHCQDVYSERV